MKNLTKEEILTFNEKHSFEKSSKSKEGNGGSNLLDYRRFSQGYTRRFYYLDGSPSWFDSIKYERMHLKHGIKKAYSY